MTSARELWPPGSKYDIDAIREKIMNEYFRRNRMIALSFTDPPIRIIVADEIYNLVYAEYRNDPTIQIVIDHEGISLDLETDSYQLLSLDRGDWSNIGIRRDYEDNRKLDQVRFAFTGDCILIRWTEYRRYSHPKSKTDLR